MSVKQVLFGATLCLSSSLCWAQELESSESSSTSASDSAQETSPDSAEPNADEANRAEPQSAELAENKNEEDSSTQAADEPSEQLPPLAPDAQRPGAVQYVDEPIPPNRWVDVGGFVGPAIRPNGSGPIQYRVGIAYGAYFRPEITSWMGVTLYYREESIPVNVESGGFDYGDTQYTEDWRQPNLKLVSLGFRAEPTWVVDPSLRIYGIVGIGWARFVAPMPEAPNQDFGRSRRAAVELDYTVGAGAYYDIIPNWLNAGLSLSYGFVGNQSGSAYEPLQIIKDGQINYLAPLPKTQSVADVLFSLAVIL